MEMLFRLFGFLALNMLLHVHAQTGFISIDCGADEDYIDDTTKLFYSTDAKFIDSGENKNIPHDFRSTIFEKQLTTVRSFPQGVKNCYTLPAEQGKDNKYLIRAVFMCGNVQEYKVQLPEFKLYLGVEEWDSVKFNSSLDFVSKEIIYVPKTDEIYVCLVNTDSGTPFISALELRPIDNSMYNKTQSGSLVLFNRYNFGSETSETVRYGDDVLDRIWLPFNWSSWEPIKAPYGSSELSQSGFKLPVKVMATAVKPVNGISLDFYLEGIDSSQEFYMYFHFAEVEDVQGQIRQFTVSLNDKTLFDAIEPKYMVSETHFTPYSLRESQLNFSIAKTNQSTLPPIMNALEIYKIQEFLQSPTEQHDIDAMKKIKSVHQVMKSSWQGDPCLPRNYPWDGLNCSENGYYAPRIISLNLSSSNLRGEMDVSFSNLTSLQYLDLSYNNLTGEVPNFLAELPSLKTLNLSWNNFTGSVPLALIEKYNDRSLSLSLDGNQYLCTEKSCDEVEEKQKKKNVAVPVVASIASVLLLLAALATMWRLKIRRQHGTDGKHKEEKKVVDSKNQHFSYSEVVSITDNFQKVIGKGGFGAVYSGHLKDGTQVAVKMLSLSSTQGSKQFRTEAQLLARVHHRNLASLIGYCDEGSNMGLIYEYMANGNLQEHLSGKNASVLSWEQRLRIAIDAAQALEYLHDGCKPPIVHRDVKTANILLNEKMQAKVGDFGLSRIFPFESETHVSTAVVGTPGYLDPEYYITMRLNEKSDVYSFGIVLLELISGQPAVIDSHGNKNHIVQWVSPIISRGEIRGIVDPRLERDFNTNSVWKAVETAMACVPSSSIQRPTMSEVVGELKECLNMEIGHERAYSVKEDMSGMISSNSLEMVVLGIDEDAMGPQAR